LLKKFAAVCLSLMLLMSFAWAEGADPGETVIEPRYPTPDYVRWLLETAQAEIGTAEGKNNTTKYGAWAGDPSAEWCAEFLCWCVDQTDRQHQTKLLDRQYPNYTGNNTGLNWFVNQGRYVSRRGIVRGWGTQWYKDTLAPVTPNSYVPQPGDWMFLSSASTWDTTHVAMVEYCAYDADGKVQVHVIEGNSPFAAVKDTVVRSSYPIDYWAILGYGTVNDVADLVMRFGNSGPKVTELQKALYAAGFFPANQKFTEKYGAITENGVKELQRQMGVPDTGIADYAVQMELRRLAAGMSPDNPDNWVNQD